MPGRRDLADRYAAAGRRKKRRPVTRPLTTAPRPETPVAETDEQNEDAAVEQTVILPARESRSAASAPRVQRGRSVPRRTFAEYRAEYAYVARDLRRVVLVAGVLLALLIVLDFIIR
jgi:hypothetical protein